VVGSALSGRQQVEVSTLRVWAELVLEVAVVVAGITAIAAAHSRNALLCLLLLLI